MKRNPLVVIFITVFIDLIGFGMIIPLGPFYATSFGATAFQVGLLMAVYSLLQFMMSPIWGRISDRIGRRPILLLSLVGAGVSHIFFGLSSELWMLFTARALAGFFGANISTAMAYVADVTGESSRSKSMGLIGAAFGLGFVLGPSLGGLVSLISPAAPAYFAGGICLLNFVLAYFVLEESLPEGKRVVAQRKGRFRSIWGRIRSPLVGDLLIISFFVAFALASLEATLFLYVKDIYGWSVKQASFGFAYVGIVMALTQGLLVRKVLPKLGEPKVLIIGLVLYGFSYFVGSVENSIWVLGLAMTLLALGSGLTNPALTGSVSIGTSALEQGETLGVLQSLSALARILGPPIGGFIYAWAGPQSPFLFAVGVSMAAIILGLRVFRLIPSRAN